MGKDTMIRILSATIGLVLFFIIIFTDQIVLDIALGAIILFMLFEFFHAFKFSFLLSSAGLVGAALLLCLLSVSRYDFFVLVLIAYISVLGMLSLFCHKTISFTDIAALLFATLYISIFTSFIGRARTIDEFGIYYLCLIFVCAWMSDTGAYFVGRFLGKSKLAPEISPKKTVAGSIGGVVFSVISSIILGVIAHYVSGAHPHYLLLALIGLVGSCLAQIGDLIASLIKRICGVKDFGNIIPGHGGLLDRFDSVIMVSPFVYYVCIFLVDMGISIL